MQPLEPPEPELFSSQQVLASFFLVHFVLKQYVVVASLTKPLVRAGVRLAPLHHATGSLIDIQLARVASYCVQRAASYCVQAFFVHGPIDPSELQLHVLQPSKYDVHPDGQVVGRVGGLDDRKKIENGNQRKRERKVD